MNEIWSQFWWERIPGTQFFLREVTAAILGYGVALVIVPEDLPWRKQMRWALGASFDTNEFGSFEFLDCQDDNPDGLLPGRFMLSRLCPENTFRSGKKENCSQYLIRTGCLDNRFIWVKGIPDKFMNEWLFFGQELQEIEKTDLEQGKYHGAIVIEVHGSSTLALTKGMVQYKDYVTEYDARNMISLIINSDEKYRSDSRIVPYFVALCGTLCGIDVEIAYHLIENCTDFHTLDPLESLKQIADKFPRRGAANNSEHILAKVRDVNRHIDIQRAIWQAQVETLFYQIEFERVKIIREYEQILTNLLIDFANNLPDIKKPEELEIGNLAWLSKNACPYPFSLEVAKRIQFLRDCRNKLAHLDICSSEELTQLLCYDN